MFMFFLIQIYYSFYHLLEEHWMYPPLLQVHTFVQIVWLWQDSVIAVIKPCQTMSPYGRCFCVQASSYSNQGDA